VIEVFNEPFLTHTGVNEMLVALRSNCKDVLLGAV
jgi:hypothetical protein